MASSDSSAASVGSVDVPSVGDVEVLENKDNIAAAEESWKDADFLCFGGDKEEGDVSSNNDVASDAQEQQQQQSGVAGDSAPAPPKIPWMSSVGTSNNWQRNVPPLVTLHNEIVNFTNLMKPTEEERMERDKLVEEVRQIAYKAFGEDKATGLLLPSSDIDVVIQLVKADEATTKNEKSNAKMQEQKEMKEWDDEAYGSPLQQFAEALKSEWQTGDANRDQLGYLEVIENTRVPLVKFTHAPTGLNVDVCFDQDNGPKAATLMKNFLDAMPPLRPLTYVLKYFMAARGINEPYSGGVGSFLLQMMIVSFLQHREREVYNNNRQGNFMNLGALLLEFFELYGVDFNYVTTGISVQNDGSYFAKGASVRRENFWQSNRPFSLALENPLEPIVDVGRASFRIQMVQRSFEVAFRILLAHMTEPMIPADSILASILPPTEEMVNRATLKTLERQQVVVGSKTGDTLAPLTTPRGEAKRSHSKKSEDSNMDTSSDDADVNSKGKRQHHGQGSKKKRRHRHST
eukprot:scaffold210037_cov61-Attheya_sp.AAC.2